ncbi:MAG: phage tail protein [Janthinobacterium lividum]
MMAQACNTEPTIGSVCVFTFDWCPRGYLPADGRSLVANQNQAIFSLIGFTYGGNGSTQFNLPDLRGRFPVGIGAAPNMTPVAIAQPVGQQSVTLTTQQVPLAAHTHASTFTGTGGGSLTIAANSGTQVINASLPVSTTVGTTSGAVSALGANQEGYLAGISGAMGPDPITVTGPYTTAAPGTNAASLKATVTVSGTPPTPEIKIPNTGITGGVVTVASNVPTAPTQQVPTQSPGLGMNVCIAVTGLYPDRP